MQTLASLQSFLTSIHPPLQPAHVVECFPGPKCPCAGDYVDTRGLHPCDSVGTWRSTLDYVYSYTVYRYTYQMLSTSYPGSLTWGFNRFV